MKSEPENFEQLKKLLALKRHEQPPPRFFQEFSSKVIDRLHHPEPTPSLTWWQRLRSDFAFQPLLNCAVGVVVCGLMLSGMWRMISIMERESAPSHMAFVTPPAESAQVLSPPGAPVVTAGAVLNPIVKPEIPDSTAPVLIASHSDSPFNQFTLRPTRAVFSWGGN